MQLIFARVCFVVVLVPQTSWAEFHQGGGVGPILHLPCCACQGARTRPENIKTRPGCKASVSMLLRLQSALGPVATYGDPSWRVDTVKQVARCPADLLGQFGAAEMLHLELSGKGCMLLLDLPFPKRIIYAYAPMVCTHWACVRPYSSLPLSKMGLRLLLCFQHDAHHLPLEVGQRLGA